MSGINLTSHLASLWHFVLSAVFQPADVSPHFWDKTDVRLVPLLIKLALLLGKEI